MARFSDEESTAPPVDRCSQSVWVTSAQIGGGRLAVELADHLFHRLRSAAAGRHDLGIPGLDTPRASRKEELVAGWREQIGGGAADANPDDSLVELAQLVDQRGEVAVACAEHEVVAVARTPTRASTDILMSAAFFRLAPIRWGSRSTRRG